MCFLYCLDAHSWQRQQLNWQEKCCFVLGLMWCLLVCWSFNGPWFRRGRRNWSVDGSYCNCWDACCTFMPVFLVVYMLNALSMGKTPFCDTRMGLRGVATIRLIGQCHCVHTCLFDCEDPHWLSIRLRALCLCLNCQTPLCSTWMILGKFYYCKYRKFQLFLPADFSAMFYFWPFPSIAWGLSHSRLYYCTSAVQAKLSTTSTCMAIMCVMLLQC